MMTYRVHCRLGHVTKHVRVHHGHNGIVLRRAGLGREKHRVPLSDGHVKLVRVIRLRPDTISLLGVLVRSEQNLCKKEKIDKPQ